MKTKNKPDYSFNAHDLMPKDKVSREILAARTSHIAKKTIETNVDHSDMQPYISFRLGEKGLYGVHYQNTEEVIDNITLTPVPRAPQCVAGVINRRGSLLTIIDLKKILQLQSKPMTTEFHSIMVVSSNGSSVGLLVDRIENSDQYPKNSLTSLSSYENILNTQIILGLHQGKVAILNIESLMLYLKNQLHVDKESL